MRLVRFTLDYDLDELTDATTDLLRANDVREDTYIRPLAYAAETSGKRFAQIGQEPRCSSTPRQWRPTSSRD